MKIIIFDFEVFKYNTLLGLIFVDGDKETLYQTWDLNTIKHLYYKAKENGYIWVGWNNFMYDNYIMEAIVNNKNPYLESKSIIADGNRKKSRFDILSYDLMAATKGSLSLKLTELIRGNNIHTTEVDFNLDRPLTKEEIELTNSYNKSDLEQTLYNFKLMRKGMDLRIKLANEFNIPLKEVFLATEAQLSEKVFGVERIHGIENQYIKPPIYPQLKLENKELWQYYLSEGFRSNIDPNNKTPKPIIHIGNAEIQIGSGGIHQALPKYYSKRIRYADISGAYNLTMINFNLLPRAMNEEAKKKYEYLYHEQIKMKKTNPLMRAVFKIILLAVFGAELNSYSKFYDPQTGSLVTITMQLFICDLLEKIAPYCNIVQCNTDGIMFEPFNEECDKKIDEIMEEWQQRTGYVTHGGYYTHLYQRDVNNYMFINENNEIEFKGEALKNYEIDEKAYAGLEIFNCVNPPIVAKGIINNLIFNKSPEETVEEYKGDNRMFQFSCKKGTYDGLEFQGKPIPNLVRCFAGKEGNGCIYKVNKDGKKAKIANLPEDVIIYNQDIHNVKLNINYDFYINRIKERILEFKKEYEQLTLF